MDEEIKIEGNLDINQALKEFEEKSATEQSYKAVKFYNQTDTPKIVKLAMKLSGAKEQKQAEYILLGFVIIAIGVSLFLFSRGGGEQKAKIEAPAGYRVIYPENEPPRIEKNF